MYVTKNQSLLVVATSLLSTFINLSIVKAAECNQYEEDPLGNIPQELDMDLRLMKNFIFSRNPDGSIRGYINGGSIEDYISDRFNKTLEGCDTEFQITQVRDTKFLFNHIYNVTLHLKSAPKDTEQKSSSKRNIGLLRGLNNIVNCSLGCDTRFDEVAGAHYDYFIASDRMMDLWLDVKIFINQIKIKKKSNQSTNGSSDIELKCTLCNQTLRAIEEYSGGEQYLFRDLGRFFKKTIAVANSIMDPNHWIALVVGVWLIFCIAVAVYREKKDKRHFKQRENYSFSAKRNPSTSDI